MFRTIAGIFLLFIFLGLAGHYLLIGKKLRSKNGSGFFYLLRSLLSLKIHSQSGFWGRRIQLGIYLLILITFLVLIATGMLPLMIFNHSISGYMLLLHAAISPIFAICLSFWVLMSIPEHIFAGSDWTQLKNLGFIPVAKKISFWIIVIPSLPVILSIVLSMFSWFGTPEQMLLAKIHRYSALLLSMAVILHLYLSILSSKDSAKKI